MGFRRGCVLAVLATASACGSSIEAPVPLTTGQRSLLVAQVTESEVVLTAFDVSDGVQPELDLDSDSTWSAQLYSASLAEMGLNEGAVPVAPPGYVARRLPDPASVFVLVGRSSSSGFTWETREEPLEALRSIWVLGEAPITQECPKLSLREFVLPYSEWISVAEPIDEQRVLVSTARGDWFIASAEGLTAFPDFGIDVPFGASHRAPDGSIWVTGCVDEPLSKIEVRDGAPVANDRSDCDFGGWTSNARANVRMEGFGEGEEFEMVTMTRSGRVLRHTSRGSEELLDIQRQVIFDWAMYVGPSEAVVTELEPQIKWLRGPGQSELITPTWAETAIQPDVYRAFRAPDGVWLTAYERSADAAVFLWERSTETWRVIGRPKIGAPLYGLAEVPDGYLVAGGNAKLGWWTSSTGYCFVDPQGPVGANGEREWNIRPYQFYLLVPVNEDEVFVGGFEGGIAPTARVWWMRRER